MKNSIQKAFDKNNRVDFVLPKYRDQSDVDAPLPIGYGQTISQPTTVKMMLEWLGAKKGDKVLDVGSGSGWTTALLSNVVGAKGKVYATERIKELKELGQKNCQKVNLQNVIFYHTKNQVGLKKFTPYDRILVSASAEEMPQVLIDQLRDDGKMVIPVKNSIYEITKTKGKLDMKEHHGFVFVPLIID